MGRRLKIITRGTPMVLTVTDEWRPSGPVHLTLTTASGQTVYAIGPSTVQTIPIPANADLTLTATPTFVPDAIIHNGDPRNLSLLISLDKAPP
jgi:hypothetical protein